MSPPLQNLRSYPVPIDTARLTPLGNCGGFSGAMFWRVSTSTGDFCLRRYPSASVSAERLTEIHDLLRHTHRQGLTFLPAPIPTHASQTHLVHDSHFWDLTPWLPGRADYHENPSPERLRAAMHALARFHLAVATLCPLEPAGSGSPAIVERIELTRRWMSGQLQQLHQSVARNPRPWLNDAARRVLARAPNRLGETLVLLEYCRTIRPPLQWCIRDIWHDHILYSGDRVTGVVDFGSAGIDSVALDVARLLGSMVRDDAHGWDDGLTAYQELRPVSEPERLLVRAFDQSTVVLSGLNWLEWIFLQGRMFEHQEGVLRRLNEILVRLEHPAIGRLDE